jgi:hypothetical protein
MKELTFIEQDLVVGGNGALAGSIGSGIGAAAFGGSSPGCAVLGGIVGGAVTVGMGMTPMGAAAGAFVTAGVSAACNNRPGYYGSNGSSGGSSGSSAGYWPSVGSGSGSGGSSGAGNGKFLFMTCKAE